MPSNPRSVISSVGVAPEAWRGRSGDPPPSPERHRRGRAGDPDPRSGDPPVPESKGRMTPEMTGDIHLLSTLFMYHEPLGEPVVVTLPPTVRNCREAFGIGNRSRGLQNCGRGWAEVRADPKCANRPAYDRMASTQRTTSVIRRSFEPGLAVVTQLPETADSLHLAGWSRKPACVSG
jgi:hypothetical protein